MQGRYLS